MFVSPFFFIVSLKQIRRSVSCRSKNSCFTFFFFVFDSVQQLDCSLGRNLRPIYYSLRLDRQDHDMRLWSGTFFTATTNTCIHTPCDHVPTKLNIRYSMRFLFTHKYWQPKTASYSSFSSYIVYRVFSTQRMPVVKLTTD